MGTLIILIITWPTLTLLVGGFAGLVVGLIGQDTMAGVIVFIFITLVGILQTAYFIALGRFTKKTVKDAGDEISNFGNGIINKFKRKKNKEGA